MTDEQLTIGTAVEVTQINGEPRRGYIVEGPLDYLRHIGSFYQIGLERPENDPVDHFQRKAGRKAPECRPPEPTAARRRKQPIFGTYEGRQIRPLI